MQEPPRSGGVLAARLPAGAQVGQYRIERRIGSGAMGEVFAAQHVVLGRRVALKVLLPELTGQRQLLERFRTEAIAAGSLRHPHIVEVSDFATDPRGPTFLVMELLEGQPLDIRLSDGGPLPWYDAVVLLDQLLAALSVAHGTGIIHRDLKPSNLFLTGKDGVHLKVLDFGLAKVTGEHAAAQHLTATGQILGTPAYMAPEQVEGAAIDARTDLYAVGCIAYELFTGRLPYTGSAMIMMLAQVSDPPAPWGQTEAPSALEDWVRHAMEKKREHRFQSADEMRDALAAAAPGAAAARAAVESRAKPKSQLTFDDPFGATMLDPPRPVSPVAPEARKVAPGERNAPPAAAAHRSARALPSEIDLVREGVASRWKPLAVSAIVALAVLGLYGLWVLAQGH